MSMMLRSPVECASSHRMVPVRRRPTHPLVLAALAVVAFGLVQVPEVAGAAAPSITATQDADHGAAVADEITITAQARAAGGQPEPDGTLVQFRDVTAAADQGIPFPGHIVGMAVHGTGPGPGDGYWMLDDHGHVLAFGGAPFLGDASGVAARGSFVAIASDGAGYILVTDAGQVFAFGMTYRGDLLLPQSPQLGSIVAATALPGDAGYRLFFDSGGVSTFDFQGSLRARARR